jgi:hypothetical protein
MIMKDTLNPGTYKQLEILGAGQHTCHDIDVNALQLLPAHCPLLKRIELVGSRFPGRAVLEDLKR